jgi:hypothetical protein
MAMQAPADLIGLAAHETSVLAMAFFKLVMAVTGAGVAFT